MAIAILTPQNCLKSGVVQSPLKSQRNSNPNSSSSSGSSNPNFNYEDATFSGRRRRRRSPANCLANRGRNRVGEPAVATAATATATVSPKSLVMGQVKILKRGEMLSSDGGVGVGVGGEDLDLDLGSTDRFGPDPDLMQKQVVLKEFKAPNEGSYAGSCAFFASPPPSSVPLPLFLDKNGTATSNLRRLLRLDLD